MTAPAVTVTLAATTGEAARIMSRHRVGRLPVRDPAHRQAGRDRDPVRPAARLPAPVRGMRAEIEAAVFSRVPAADRHGWQ